MLIVAFAALLVGGKLFGINAYTVISGSMEPTYPVGCLIYVADAEPSEVKVNDVITYVLPSNTPCTHRVIGIDEENQKFYTKGDNNNIEDGEPVHFKNLIGKPIFHIPYLGYAANYIQNPPGRYVVFAGGCLLVLFAFLPDVIVALLKGDEPKPENAEAAGNGSPDPDENTETDKPVENPEDNGDNTAG